MIAESSKDKTPKIEVKQDKEALKAEIQRIKALQEKLEQSKFITKEVMHLEFTI